MPKNSVVSLTTSSKRPLVSQVDEPNYFTMPYLSRERWISFWYQLLEVYETSSRNVLEIGPGPGVVSWILRRMGMSVTTLDIDERLRPRVVGDITRLPFADQSFDTVLVAEVLEHIPFAEVPRALRELTRVTRKSVVVTLPHFSHFVPSIAFKLFPFVPRFSKVFPMSFPVLHRFDGQHYWEIGKWGTSLSQVKQTLTMHTSFLMKKDYLIEENPFHHVFVLEKSKE